MQTPAGMMPTGLGLLLAALTCVATEGAGTTVAVVEVLTLMVDHLNGMPSLLLPSHPPILPAHLPFPDSHWTHT